MQSTLKHFCEVVKSNSIDRVTKFVEKGLDPNYIDQDTGGKYLVGVVQVFPAAF